MPETRLPVKALSVTRTSALALMAPPFAGALFVWKVEARTSRTPPASSAPPENVFAWFLANVDDMTLIGPESDATAPPPNPAKLPKKSAPVMVRPPPALMPPP